MSTTSTLKIKLEKQEDDVTQKLIKQLGNEKFIDLKDDYTNEALDQFMLNSNDLGDRCLEHEGRLIQRIEPVYLDPTESNLGVRTFLCTK
jgi:hypothetical protein